MYKFKVSKYKNVNATIPKKNEGWITEDINVNNYPNQSNLIKSSASLIGYFREGGSIGIANINDFQQKPSILRANGSETSDLDFSPFDDGILATSSNSGHINIWQLTQLFPNILIPKNAIHSFDCSEPISLLKFHSTVETILSFATRTQLKLYDIIKGQTIIESNKCSQIQSIDCKYDAKLYALTDGEDSHIKIWDPRIEDSKPFAIEFKGHDNDRDSRVVWLGDRPYIVSCGFNKRKAREAFLWDIRSNQKPITSVNEFESSAGIWIPFFDFDTQMIFIAGRNDSTVNHWEVNDLINGTTQLDNNGINKKSVDLHIKGATLAPKRALNIMETEVNRVILLGADSIAPVSYRVPRKTYREFHSDLFPETKSPDSAISLNDWLELKDNTIPTINLNPNLNKREKLIRLGKTLGSELKIECSDREVDQFFDICQKDGIDVNASLKDLIENPKSNEKEFIAENKINGSPKVDPIVNVSSPRPQSQRKGFTIRTTKFRHLKGTILGRETHITNFNGLSKTIPGECDVFKVNSKFGAVPIGPSCNQLAIFDLSKGRRLSGGVIPHLVCGHTITDYSFDPFDEYKIAVGCDNGTVQFWSLPEEGLTENLDKFNRKLLAHNERLTIIQFHPNASHVLATFAMDFDLIIWNTRTLEQKIKISAHSEPLFGMSWSPDGSLLATVSKDQKIRVFDPRNERTPIREGLATQGSRGGRVCWAQKGDLLIVTGFSRVSERQFLVFDKNDLSKPIASEGLDVSPAILIPFYDEDSSTLFLTGKGDSTIFTFEISSPADGPPYVHHLSHYNTPTPHQSVAYLYKCFCDVRNVEFARGYRLTSNSIEPVSFTVPRLRTEYFQDDLFPSTRVLWSPLLSSDQWFSGQNEKSLYISLKPKDMDLLTEAQPPAPPKKENNSQNSVSIQFEGDIPLQSSLAFLSGGRQKQEMIVQQMSDKVQFKDEELPQENYEGVDPNEWDDN